jgi:hypothetical protein
VGGGTVRNLLLFGIFLIFLCICAGFFVASTIYFIRLGRETTTETIRQELSQLEQERLPQPDSIDLQYYERAGIEIPLYVVTISYEHTDKREAEEMIKQIRKRLK